MNLCICLKRFKKTHSWYKKSKVSISVDPELDLTPFYIQRDQHKKSIKYELYGATHHSGSLGGGHYTSYIKVQNQWYYISDSYVQKSSLNQCISSDPYMLFYRLK